MAEKTIYNVDGQENGSDLYNSHKVDCVNCGTDTDRASGNKDRFECPDCGVRVTFYPGGISSDSDVVAELLAEPSVAQSISNRHGVEYR